MLVKLANSAKAGISFLPALWALAAVLVLAALTALPHPLLDHSEEFRTLHPQYRGDYRGYLVERTRFGVPMRIWVRGVMCNL